MYYLRKNFFLKTNEKSLAFFSKKKNISINNKTIKYLKKIAKKKKIDVRICLHRNVKELVHSMIICQVKKKFYFWSKHKNTDEIYQIISGKLLVLTKIHKKINKFEINKRNFIFKLSKNIEHVTIPLTNYCVFHEIRRGPFLKKDTKFLKKIDNQYVKKNFL